MLQRLWKYRFFRWIYNDWKSHPYRFLIEIHAWFLSIGCALCVSLTVPNPPFLILYPLWLIGCSLYAWAAWSRKSFGMLANYFLLITIDFIGYLRVL
jgi:hypothetical protein